MPRLPIVRSTLAVVIAVSAIALTACSRPTSGRAGDAPSGRLETVKETKLKEPPPPGANAQLAITRRVRLELADDKIAPLYRDVQAACAADTADACVVLHAELDVSGLPGVMGLPSATLSLRAAPAGIAKLLDRLHGSGRVADEGMDAEDLAAPIADGDRRIAMLRQYRDSLVALRDRPGNNIDALIRINQELAQTQSQLESATGDNAHLHQRVDTQVLDVQLSSPRAEPHATPVGDALSSFWSNFSNAVGNVITFVAWALPWLVLLVPVVWGLRKLLAWRRRARG